MRCRIDLKRGILYIGPDMMIETASHYLLPSGLRDLLPPDARHQTHIVQTLLARFERMGYDQVMPPLAEYEQTLLSGSAKALEKSTFRLMDPADGQMLAIRSDMTMQVSRIAESRLSHAPLPLRLSYAGNVLRTGAGESTSERQFTQAGLELIGCDAASADAEVIETLLEALSSLGFSGLVVDLNAAGLLDALLAEETAPYDKPALIAALRHKDASALPPALACREALSALLETAGSPQNVREAMQRFRLPSAARLLIEQLFAVLACLPAREGVSFTVDPLEQAGLEYHYGVCFSLFHSASRQEIGRGGRYSLMHGGASCPATGATLYVGRLLASFVPENQPLRALIPYGTPLEHTRRFREEGIVTVSSLTPGTDSATEAKKLGCTHIYDGERLVPCA